jgi:hypothetical protein
MKLHISKEEVEQLVRDAFDMPSTVEIVIGKSTDLLSLFSEMAAAKTEGKKVPATLAVRDQVGVSLKPAKVFTDEFFNMYSCSFHNFQVLFAKHFGTN